MRPQSVETTNVVLFPGPRAARSQSRDQKGLLDTVYTSGSFVIAAEDRETKLMASRLQVFGFLNVSELQLDGSVRSMRPSEAARASSARPWRLSRPSFDELPPLAG